MLHTADGPLTSQWPADRSGSLAIGDLVLKASRPWR